MTNAYSLDDLKNDLDREFAPLGLNVGGETLVLRNLMRIDDEDRKTVMEALKDVNDIQGDDEDYQPTPEETATLANAVRVVLATVVADGKGYKLGEAINGDLALSMKILSLWTEATQPGEAQNSPA